jgi:serine protease Do
VADVVASLRESGSVTRGWLGVGIQPVEEDMAEAIGLKTAEGALVSEVHGDTPAAKAGIKNEDVILSLNGQKVADPRELTRMVGSLKPGSDANLKVWRDGKEQDITVKLGTRPDDPNQARKDQDDRERPGQAEPSSIEDLGITVGPSDGGGVAVTEVDPSSPVAEKLRQGDVILEVSGTPVSSPSELAEAVEALRQDKKRFATFRVKSSGSGNARYVAVQITKS